MASRHSANPQKVLLESAFGDAEFADAVVSCQGISWKVHKIIVCKASKYFHKAFTAGFKESIDGKIDIEDEHPSIIRAILEFIYLGRYDLEGFFVGSTPFFDTESFDNIAMLHATMYCVADKLEIFGLQYYALLELERAFYSDDDDVHKKIGNWCDLAHIAYNELPDSDVGLKDLLVRTLGPYLEQLLEDKDFVRQLGQLGDFAVALMKQPHYPMVSVKKLVTCRAPMRGVMTVKMQCTVLKGMTFLELGDFKCPNCDADLELH